jgi:nitroimidazol reductase NimA-like FMN-containing flavoprotein (pyridoxamine 5'-phosphate oxidase superfamily)
MALSRDLALTDDERDEILSSEWNMRISTVSPSGRINSTPLWFAWHDGQIWAYCRGQKVKNMRRDPRATVLVDRNERFPELQGIMIQGDVTILEDAAAEDAEAGMAEVRRIMGRKYHGGHGEADGEEPVLNTASARGSSWRWVKIAPTRTITWDNTKLPTGAAG